MTVVMVTVNRPEVDLSGTGQGHTADRNAREGDDELLVHGRVPFFLMLRVADIK